MKCIFRVFAFFVFLSTTMPLAYATGWVQIFGANAASAVAVERNADGRLEIFIRRANGTLWHSHQLASGAPNWSSWATLAGNISGNPVVVRNVDGRLEVFARAGNSAALVHIKQASPNSTSWSQWTSLGGSIFSTPAVAVNADGRLEVFAKSFGTGTGSAYADLRHIWQTTAGGAWSSWASLGGTIASPTVSRNSDGRLEVFALGATGHLKHIWQALPSAGPWSSWGSLGGSSISSRPEVFQNADGRLDVFVRGLATQVWHIGQTHPSAGPWSSWASLNGTLLIGVSPRVSRNQDGRLELFARNPNGIVQHAWQNQMNVGPWSSWHSLDGAPVTAGNPTEVAVAQNADGRLQLFVIVNGQVETTWQTSANNGWLP